MSSDLAIDAESLGKSYLLGHHAQRERYTALRDVLARNTRTFLQTARDLLQGRQIVSGDHVEEFWALRDVTFQIKHGEVLGVVGRNGAGKSTLLKVLSRITEPSKGRVTIRGRISSLLEVGTGFHPELTGRENIYLNGAILGMSRREISRKFEEIVSFAEVEKFLDTPVKRYSSGMYVRLAFAVAAHLDPEILIIDEVLAVGDLEFQRKCLGKMEDASRGGRTVIFVSHNMDAVLRLCSRAILLKNGVKALEGPVAEVVSNYTSTIANQPTIVPFSHLSSREKEEKGAILVSANWPDSSLHAPWTIPFGERISFSIVVECKRAIRGAELGLALLAPSGTEIASTSSIVAHSNLNLSKGEHVFHVSYESIDLVPNHYTFGIGLKSENKIEDINPQAFSIDILASNKSSAAKTDTFLGYIVPEVSYEIE